MQRLSVAFDSVSMAIEMLILWYKNILNLNQDT